MKKIKSIKIIFLNGGAAGGIEDGAGGIEGTTWLIDKVADDIEEAACCIGGLALTIEEPALGIEGLA